MGFESETLGFEGNASASSERIKHRWNLPVVGLKYRLVCFGECCIVAGAVPLDDALEECVQLLSGKHLVFHCGIQVWPGTGVVHELSEEHSTCRG